MKNFENIFSKGTHTAYKKKSIIFSPTIPPKGMYRIQSGFTYTYSLTKDNKKRIQTILKIGDIFPLIMNTMGTPSLFYMEAITNVTIARIETTQFFNKIYTNTSLNQEFIQILSTYLGNYVQRLENLELETIEQRIIARLLYFASRFGETRDGSIFIQLPITHDFIAQSINVSRSNVSRELSKLEKQGLITFHGKHLIILNEKKLATDNNNFPSN